MADIDKSLPNVKTSIEVDPQEEIIGILMSQSMMQFEKPEADLQVLTYQALIA